MTRSLRRTNGQKDGRGLSGGKWSNFPELLFLPKDMAVACIDFEIAVIDVTIMTFK